MAHAIVADRNTVENNTGPPSTLEKNDEFEEILTEQLSSAPRNGGRHRLRGFQAAETTQIVITTTATVKRFDGTQFLYTPYLGEQAVSQPVWAMSATKSSTTTGKAESSSEDLTEKFEESKSIESMPTAQHLPPGANCQIAEKKSKAKRRGEGKKSCCKSNDDDDSKSDEGGAEGGAKGDGGRKNHDDDDDEPRRHGYK